MCSVLHWLTVVRKGGRVWCESGSTQNSSSLFQPGHTVPNKLSCAKFSDHIFPADLACVYDLLGKRSLTGQSLESDWTGFVSWLPKHLMARTHSSREHRSQRESPPSVTGLKNFTGWGEILQSWGETFTDVQPDILQATMLLYQLFSSSKLLQPCSHH